MPIPSQAVYQGSRLTKQMVLILVNALLAGKTLVLTEPQFLRPLHPQNVRVTFPYVPSLTIAASLLLSPTHPWLIPPASSVSALAFPINPVSAESRAPL